MTAAGACLLLLVSTTVAAAQPTALSPDEPTAADVATAPRPGEESGRVDAEPGDSTARLVARGGLFLPRMAFAALLKPVEGVVWVEERYQIRARAQRLFWNAAGTAGLMPTVHLESGFGLNAGARFVHRDVLGAGEQVTLDASTGGRFRELARVRFRSGERMPGVELALDARYERRPKDAFYGIGNADAAVDARYRDRVMRATTSADVQLGSAVHATFAGALSDHEYSPSTTGRPIGELYMTDALTGFDGTRAGYAEVELRWDTRGNASIWDVPSIVSTGSLLAAYAGRSVALDAHPSYWRYGADIQRFVRLAAGPRVLAFRGHVDAVSGAVEEVPFTELPRLGGNKLLRGYPGDRFRDRIALAAGIDYRWDLARNVSGTLFVDAGRVQRSIADIALDHVRIGYGVGLEVYGARSLIARVSAASSLDGGVFVDLALDPVFDLDRRVDRR